MDCPTPAELAAFLAGKLPRPRTAWIAGHVRISPAARTELRAIEVRGRRLSRPCPPWPTDAPTDPVPNDCWKRRPLGAVAAPAKLGRLRIQRRGRGGPFGTVYKARDPELDRTVAIKISARAASADPDEAGAVPARGPQRRPAEASGHRVALRDRPGRGQLLPGRGVRRGRDAGRPARPPGARRFREAAELIAEVAEALEYAHEQGVVHRDIKPSNIMLDADGPAAPDGLRPGQARRPDEITMTLDGQVLGTPAYMSPEQARGEGAQRRWPQRRLQPGRDPLRAADRRAAVPRATARMLLHQVLHDEPRPPRRLNDRIPRDLETICLKAMAKEPAGRYATAGELADDLRRWLAGEPIQARPNRPAGAAVALDPPPAGRGGAVGVACWPRSAGVSARSS